MLRRSKQIKENKEQFASFDDLHQDQRPILCRNSERNLIVSVGTRAEA